MVSDLNENIRPIDRDVGSGSVSGQSAQDEAYDKAVMQPLPMSECVLPYFVLFFLIAFVVSSWFTSLPRYGSTASDLNAATSVATKAILWEQCPTLFLVLLTASFGIWFVLTFTDSPLPRAKRRQCFRFAYSFTITTFIILTFPFLGIWKPDISGPIGLIRGCVDISNQLPHEQIAPMSVACTYRDQGKDQSNGASTSSVKSTEKPGSPGLKGKPVEKTVSSDKTNDKAIALTGDKSAENSGNKEAVKVTEALAYPWLLTIGGFTGKTVCIVRGETAQCPGKETDSNHHSEITNGLVVPFYIVFLAFIGGAVSLSRRIPEYQKRSEEKYKPASDLATLSAMNPYEARESAVFQIMQLISAPFIAITAYWVIAPSTVPASIGLAFVSGFASETILMLIRGVVDGIRPQTTLFAGAEKPGKKPETTTQDEKKDADQATPSVSVHLAVQTDLPLDPGSMALTVDAAPVALSAEGFIELPLDINRAYVLVATGRSKGDALRAEMTITPSVNDEGKPFSLILRRQ